MIKVKKFLYNYIKKQFGFEMIKIKTLDLVGKTFEELTVLEWDLSINKKGTYWKCLCSCGNVKTIRGTSKDFNKIDNNYLKAKLISKGV